MLWPRVMTVLCIVFISYVLYLYLKGSLRLGPAGKEWEGTVDTTTDLSKCPPPECDCNALRARIRFLERKLADTEAALLKAEGLYSALYQKYLALLQEMEAWKRRALEAEALNEDLRARLAACQEELAACRAELEALRAQCLERDLHLNACSPGLSRPGTLLR